MEDDIRPIRDQLFGEACYCEITGHDIDRNPALADAGHDVLKRHPRDIAVAETSVAQQPLGHLRPTMPAAPRTRICKTQLLLLDY